MSVMKDAALAGAPVRRVYSPAAILTLLAIIVFFAVINGTMVNIALPFIGAEFGVGEGIYGWVVTGFALTFGIFSAVHGRLADSFGLRRLYVGGILVLGVCSLLVAIAPTIEIVLVTRVIQGAGSAAMPALGPVIVARLLPASERGASMGVILGAVGFAASIGPFLGGLVVQFLGWRAVFAVTGLVLLFVPIAWKMLPKDLDECPGGRFDAFGATLLGAGAAGLMLSLNVFASVGPSVLFFAGLGASIGVLLAFVWWIRRASDPFIPPRLFGDRRYIALVVAGFASNAARFGSIVLVPIFLVEVNELEPIWIGVVLLPGALAIAFLSRLAGRFSDRHGARYPVAFGSIMIALGNVVTAAYAGGSPWGVGVGMLLYGLGFAFMQSPLLSATSLILPRESAGVGVGTFMMIFFLGGATGVAVALGAVELQPRDAPSWLRLASTDAAIFSNAVLTLTLMAFIGLLCTPFIPGRESVIRDR